MFFSDNGEIEKEGIKSAAAISLFNLLFYIPKNKETALYEKSFFYHIVLI